jgi:hypothetical protein
MDKELPIIRERLGWIALWCFLIACNTCEMDSKLQKLLHQSALTPKEKE